MNLDSWGKSHMSSPCLFFITFPCLIQPPFLMFYWVVEAVIAGSGGWQDCQSFPHAHSTSPLSTFTWVREPSPRHSLGRWGSLSRKDAQGAGSSSSCRAELSVVQFLVGGSPVSLSHHLQVCSCVLSSGIMHRVSVLPPPFSDCEKLLWVSFVDSWVVVFDFFLLATISFWD